MHMQDIMKQVVKIREELGVHMSLKEGMKGFVAEFSFLVYIHNFPIRF